MFALIRAIKLEKRCTIAIHLKVKHLDLVINIMHFFPLVRKHKKEPFEDSFISHSFRFRFQD